MKNLQLLLFMTVFLMSMTNQAGAVAERQYATGIQQENAVQDQQKLNTIDMALSRHGVDILFPTNPENSVSIQQAVDIQSRFKD